VRVPSLRIWVTLAAGVSVVLAGTNMILFEKDRSLQADVNARAQFLQQTAQLEILHREIVSAIANLSTRNKDDALGAVLSRHGITFQATSPPGLGMSPTAPPAADPKRHR